MDVTSRIFLAGHKGLVGSAIYRHLRAKGYRNIITAGREELDLTSQAAVDRFFAEKRPEFVFLAAAKVGGIIANSTYKADFIYENIAIASNVIHSAFRHGTIKLLNLGSSCIYPKFAPQPIREDALLTGVLEATNEPYAIAKIAAIKLCRYFNEQYGTNYISLMPTNLYGPHDNFNLETSHVLPSLIRKFHLAKLLAQDAHQLIRADIAHYKIGFGADGRLARTSNAELEAELAKAGITRDQIVIWGTGEPRREFLHVDDLAGACVYFMNSLDYAATGEFVNIGTGADMKIREVASIIKDVTGFKGAIVHDTTKPDGTPRKLLDVSRAASLGWKAGIPLEDGIKETYAWYLGKTAGDPVT